MSRWWQQQRLPAVTASSLHYPMDMIRSSVRAVPPYPVVRNSVLKNAPIVILDEATASVDPENEHLIQQALSALTRGKTILTIAHRLATIQHADQILVVDDGHIAEHGTHEELLAQSGVYRRFVEIRKQAEGWRLA